MCDTTGAEGWCAFYVCQSWCDITGNGGDLDSWMVCPNVVCDNIHRMEDRHEETIATTSSLESSITEITKRNVTACTNACWFDGIVYSGCNSGKTEAETACMCSSEANYEVGHCSHQATLSHAGLNLFADFEQRFYDCDIVCMVRGESDDLTPAQECVGFKHQARDAAAVAPPHPDVGPSSELAAVESMLQSLLSEIGPRGAPTLAPTTFSTAVRRAASPQIAALTPWKTEAPKAPKPPKPYTHYSMAPTIGFCGVPGQSCNEKFKVESSSTDSSMPSMITARDADAQIAALTPWKPEPPKAPKPPKPYTHYSMAATIGFCGVPGQSCNEKLEVEGDSSSVQMLDTSVIEVRDATATFIPSLVRMCEEPDLVDCYTPLPPDPANIDQRNAATPATFVAPVAAPGELATYGHPTTTMSYGYAGDCDPDLNGNCGGAKRDAAPELVA